MPRGDISVSACQSRDRAQKTLGSWPLHRSYFLGLKTSLALGPRAIPLSTHDELSGNKSFPINAGPLWLAWHLFAELLGVEIRYIAFIIFPQLGHGYSFLMSPAPWEIF